MQAIFVAFFHFLITILNYQHFDAYMASRLYKLRTPQSNATSLSKRLSESKFFSPSKTGSIRTFLMDCLPPFLVCCRKSRTE